MAISQRQWRAIGVAVPAVTGLTLLGITFGVGINTKLFNLLSVKTLLGALNIALAIAIYRNRI